MLSLCLGAGLGECGIDGGRADEEDFVDDDPHETLRAYARCYLGAPPLPDADDGGDDPDGLRVETIGGCQTQAERGAASSVRAEARFVSRELSGPRRASRRDSSRKSCLSR